MVPMFSKFEQLPLLGTELEVKETGTRVEGWGKRGEVAAVGWGIPLILALACSKSGESQDRAFYHDPLFVSHAQHLQTVQARLPLGCWRAVQLGGR